MPFGFGKGGGRGRGSGRRVGHHPIYPGSTLTYQ